MPDALIAGRIDVAYFTEPWLAVARKSGRLLAYPYDAVAKEFLYGSWFTMSQWAHDHPDLVAKFVSAIREAGDWANANPAKSADILAKYTKIEPAVVEAMVRVRFGDRLTASMMQPEIDLAAKYGKFARFPASELIYTR